MKRLIPVYAILTAFVFIVSASCNSSDSDEPVVLSSSTLVTGFSLAENDSVMELLDSLKFTIDLDNYVIYNADSLPKGTDITRLVAYITFSTTVSAGEITITDATTMSDTTFNYTSSDTDSIDFTGKVYLKVTAANGVSTSNYQLKVNVHQVESDSLYWNQLSRRNLPSTAATPTDQKTVKKGSAYYCLVSTSGGYAISSTEALDANSWSRVSVDFGFTPDIPSLCATDDALYILSDSGELYTSTDDGATWTSTGKTCHSLIGGYGSTLQAITLDNGTYYHETYPETTKTAADDEFPVSGFSQAVSYSSSWSTGDIILIAGGTKADGSPTGDVWGYDGYGWEELSEEPMPARTGMTLIPYYYFIQDDDNITYTRYPVLLAMGGKDANGDIDNDVYISYDNGVVWKLGDDLLQLPDYMPDFYGAQAFVASTTLTRSSSSVWTDLAPRSLPYWWKIDNGYYLTRVSQAVTSWECPYIYVFGGYNASGELLNSIWKGVVNRLTYKPVI